MIYCKSGIRSARALNTLRQLGFRKLLNLKGGITAWAEDVDTLYAEVLIAFGNVVSKRPTPTPPHFRGEGLLIC